MSRITYSRSPQAKSNDSIDSKSPMLNARAFVSTSQRFPASIAFRGIETESSSLPRCRIVSLDVLSGFGPKSMLSDAILGTAFARSCHAARPQASEPSDEFDTSEIKVTNSWLSLS